MQPLVASPSLLRQAPVCAAAAENARQRIRQHAAGRHRPGLLTRASAVKEERKTTSGRKEGESGKTGSSRSASTTTSGRKEGSGSTRTAPPPPRQQPRPRAGPATPQPTSQLDQYMRKHPFFSRFFDTTLLLGDCVMIIATEASSERIEWSSFPLLVAVLLVSWVGAGAVNGDYSPSGSRAHEDVPWQLSMLGPTFGSVMAAALTWAFASTASVAAYALMVDRHWLDAAPLMEGLNTDDLSPQLEVVVALLITMVCWRGIASKLRPTPPGL
ncbi:hypothetical protein TSOC_010365 [Tetrabaena socialis]|uniref:Uncharacterized protein n=1 Tax=Tetrabaena socialis TaxID=47790 RepID=A0A2J7ZTE5_9CHLO|nr:hypothetical protein TSOC_010365 [Tetrabaena socialis]|eukprot:PNH03543.1 hypothetical protein TSOC_010365 [Tetrabaena socialis]